MERRCPNLLFSRFPPPGTRRRWSGAGIATTFPPPPMRRRSTNCWKRFPRWRSIYCRTITRISRPSRYSCRSPRCAKPNRLNGAAVRSRAAGLAARRRLHAGPARARQSRNLVQPNHEAKLRRARRHSQPTHRQRAFASRRMAACRARIYFGRSLRAAKLPALAIWMVRCPDISTA